MSLLDIGTLGLLQKKKLNDFSLIRAYGEMAAARVLGPLVFQDVQVQILLGTPNSNIKVKTTASK